VTAGVLVLTAGAPAPASSRCPTETFLSLGHLAYVSKTIPATVHLAPGRRLGSATIDEPAGKDGCRRRRETVDALAAGPIEAAVAMMAKGRPQTLFVIGHRCDGLAGRGYWDCLLRPLVVDGRRYTGTSYPLEPAPRKTVPLTATLGTGTLAGRTVTVRHIAGVDPAVAVGVSGHPSEAFLAATTCPYEGFSNAGSFDDLLRCLRSPVWFTFDPPGSRTGGKVVARSDRRPAAGVAGASIGLVRLSLVADLVPKGHGVPAHIGSVSREVSFRVPDVPPGLYEAVVACPRCAPGGTTLFPAGSLLVVERRKGSVGVKIVSFALAAAFAAAAILGIRAWRKARRLRPRRRAGS
jgi:hypothetical protein